MIEIKLIFLLQTRNTTTFSKYKPLVKFNYELVHFKLSLYFRLLLFYTFSIHLFRYFIELTNFKSVNLPVERYLMRTVF